MKNIIYCPSCDESTLFIYSNSRIQKYECNNCNLIIILYVHGKYIESTNLEIVLGTNRKYFKTQDLKQNNEDAIILLDTDLKNI